MCFTVSTNTTLGSNIDIFLLKLLDINCATISFVIIIFFCVALAVKTHISRCLLPYSHYNRLHFQYSVRSNFIVLLIYFGVALAVKLSHLA